MRLLEVQWIAYAAAIAAVLAPLFAQGSALQIKLTDSHNHSAEGLGIVVEASTPEPPPTAPLSAVIDQSHEQFVPRVLIVRRGTEVSFPNTDRVQHHVYSFSAAKQFELALYRGNEHPPVTFDRPGIAVLGCNIHDHMVGYVLIVDGSHFGFTDRDGRLVLDGLPNETVKVTVWHPDLGVEYGAISRTINLTPGKNSTEIRLDQAWQSKQEQALSWNDY